MKTRTLVGLYVVLGCCILVRADDNPDQAAARAALTQKMIELDKPETQPAHVDNSVAVATQTGESTNNLTVKVVTKEPASQTAAPVKSQVAAPANKAPTVTPPANVAPAVTVRLVAAPARTQPEATPRPAQSLAPMKPSNPTVPVKPANDIRTTTGTVYKDVQVERVEPDGIIISYAIAGGGLAMTKIHFTDLSAELRQRYEK